MLCEACARAVPVPGGLLPAHLSSRVSRDRAAGWLIDGFGNPHALGETRTRVGRDEASDLSILHASVSREHAELTAGAAWQLRDVGSRNGTTVDGRAHSRGPVDDGALIRIGEVALRFLGRRVAMPDPRPMSMVTAHVTSRRFVMTSPSTELCLVGSGGADSDATGGSLLHRAIGTTTWSEVALPPLEFQLLRILCDRAVAEAASPSLARGCVPSKQLAKLLPFQSRYASEENVRQVVHRVRGNLEEIRVVGLIEAQPRRGYYLTWPVTVEQGG